MKTEQVRRMSPEDRFFYWIRERHQIYLRRQRGEPRPWTDDEILQSYFFTNPYRENDKTTVWFRENVRDHLRQRPEILFATVCFRWFNWIPTGRVLIESSLGNPPAEFGLLERWDQKAAIRVLSIVREGGQQVFTGAYMIKGETGRKKVESVCDRINAVWLERQRLVDLCRRERRLETLVNALREFPYLGGFMAYEIACDLRYTYLLEDAVDVDTWCNPGPGCHRGLMRLSGITPPKNRFGRQKRNGNKIPADWLDQMRKLLAQARQRFYKMPRMEMREIEHSLCEFDKYERALHGDGHMKRLYNGRGDK